MDKKSRFSFPLLAVLALALTWAAGPVFAEDAPATETESEIAQPAPGAVEASEVTVPLSFGGLRIVVDQRTGRILTDPAAQTRLGLIVDPELLRRMDTSHEDLVEQSGPRGGVMVNLQGRFMSPLVAVVNPDGSVQMDHATLASESNDAQDQAKEAGHETP